MRTGLRTLLFAIPLAVGSAAAQSLAPSTDVYLFRLDQPRAGVVNITKRVGYDNQPSWLGDTVYLTVQSDGQTDIHRFTDGRVTPVTTTPESEYSAAVTPDGRGFAVIRVEMDSSQRLWRFPLRTREAPSVVLRDVKPVGYFAYLDSTTLALFVLGGNGSPATLQIADTRTGMGTVVATSPGRSIQRIPGTRRASFTRRSGGRTVLLSVDATPRRDGTFAIDTIAALPDSADYVVWRSASHAYTGAGSRLFELRLPSREWAVVADLGPQGIRGISRLALSPDGSRLALVAEEPRAP